MERIDQEDTSKQALQPDHESPPSPTLLAAQQKKRNPLATRKGMLLCTLAVLLIGVGVIVGILKLQTPSGRVKWTYHIGNLGGSSPTVSNGILYIGNAENMVYALSAASGQMLWSTQLGHYTDFGAGVISGIVPAPVVDNGMVYANSQDGFLYALDALSGHTIWSYRVPYAAKAPAVANGVVYIGAEDGTLSALEASSGHKLWSYQSSFPNYFDFLETSPVVEQGVIYIASDDGVVALDAMSGREKWAGGAGNGGFAPAVANGLVYVTGSSLVYALDATSGELKWLSFRPEGFTSSPVVAGDTIYANSYVGVFALNRANGSERWLYRMPGTLAGLTVVNETVYVGSGDTSTINNGSSTSQPDAKLYALDAASGKAQWFYQLDGAVFSTPAVSNGVVYMSTQDGTLYALLPPA